MLRTSGGGIILTEGCLIMDSNEIYSEIIKNNLKEKRYYQNMLVRASWGSPHPEREEIEDRINIRPAFFHDTTG